MKLLSPCWCDAVWVHNRRGQRSVGMVRESDTYPEARTLVLSVISSTFPSGITGAIERAHNVWG